MKIQEKKYMRDSQNETYLDPAKWHISTQVSLSQRLRSVLLYTKILELYGVINAQRLTQNLKVLEPGCGIGGLSVILSTLGEVYSFDYSDIAIKTALTLFQNVKSLRFFEGDGTEPQKIPELFQQEFDFILIRQFHPLCRNIAGGPEPICLVNEYYNLLKRGGVIIIEHSLPRNAWKGSDDILQTSQILKRFNARAFNTLSMYGMLTFAPHIKNKKICRCLLMLLDLIAAMYCYVKKCNLSKMIIIKK